MDHFTGGSRARTLRRRSVAVLALIAVFACAPDGAPAQAPVDVDTERLLDDLRALAHDSLQGRAPGTEGNRKARDFIYQRLTALGLHPVADTFEIRRDDGAVAGVNVRALIRGTEVPDRYLVLTAHYDHLGVRNGEVFNGADDNASGTAALLALAADLVRSPPRHSVLVAFVDAEEAGLRGARALVAAPPVPREAMLVNVNLDMVGHSDSELWAVGTTQYPALRPVVEAVPAVPPVVVRFGHDTEQDQGADNWVNASDHAAFHREGIPFLYFGVADHPDYHRATDDAETIGEAFFTAAVKTIGRVVRALDGALAGTRPLGAGAG